MQSATLCILGLLCRSVRDAVRQVRVLRGGADHDVFPRFCLPVGKRKSRSGMEAVTASVACILGAVSVDASAAP